MNHYETVFILTPVLSDVQMKEAVDKFKTILTEQGAVIVNEENWGLRKLAYPIQKKTTGFYNLLEFDADPSVIAKLEVQFRRDERVIRFLTFRMDKFAAEYAADKKGKRIRDGRYDEDEEQSQRRSIGKSVRQNHRREHRCGIEPAQHCRARVFHVCISMVEYQKAKKRQTQPKRS